MTPDPLATLRKAHTARRRADDRYRAALLAAVAAGHSYADIGRALGVARQTIFKAVRRAT